MSKATPLSVKERSTGSLYRAVNTSNSSEVLHLDRDCPSLTGAERVRTVEKAAYPNTPICKKCQGEVERVDTRSTLAAQLRQADSLEELREGSA